MFEGSTRAADRGLFQLWMWVLQVIRFLMTAICKNFDLQLSEPTSNGLFDNGRVGGAQWRVKTSRRNGQDNDATRMFAFPVWRARSHRSKSPMKCVFRYFIVEDLKCLNLCKKYTYCFRTMELMSCGKVLQITTAKPVGGTGCFALKRKF